MQNRIKFKSFIAINRNIDREVFKDSKLVSLIIYFSLRVKRANSANVKFGVSLNPGEFIIGRLVTSKETDLTEAEYRTRFNRLQQLKVIEIIKTTNHYTLCRWLDNRFIDLNINNPQPTDNQPSTTTNNLIDFISSNLISNNQYKYNPSIYIKLLGIYKDCKGITLLGNEKVGVLKVIDEMLLAGRKPEEIERLIRWFGSVAEDENYPWVKNWTINTVQKKLPEFLAGKFKIRTMADDYETITLERRN